MQVTIFGASGKVGQLVTTGLLEQGHEVVAFVHRHTPFPDQTRLSLQRGDIHDAVAVARAMAGSGVVISTLGSWGAPSKDIVSTATQHIIQAAQTHTPQRFISVTGAEAEFTSEVSSFLHALSHFALQRMARPVLSDAERHLKLLAESNLNWTAIRSPVMTDRRTAAYTLTGCRPAPWTTISRQAVAAAIIAQITDQTWSRQAPFIRSAS